MFIQTVGEWCTSAVLKEVLDDLAININLEDKRSQAVLEDALLTCFAGCLSSNMAQHLVNLMLNVCWDQVQNKSYKPGNSAELKLPMICIEGESVMESCCIDGLILTDPIQNNTSFAVLEEPLLLVLNCPVEMELCEGAALEQELKQMGTNFRFATINLTKKLALLQDKGIKLLISTYTASEIAQEVLADEKILLISGVQEESIEDICRIAKTGALTDFLPGTIANAAPAKAKCCKQVEEERS